jgi:hypothetical protein
VKDVLRKGEYLLVLTAEKVRSVNIAINYSRDYKTCIDCASDPECMWSNNDHECEEYKENSSIFLKNPTNINNISCHGMRSDYDKLYNNTEYEWINSMNLSNY